MNAGQSIRLHATAPQVCNYLPDRVAVLHFASTDRRWNLPLQTLLLEHGFRRTGEHLYRPGCPTCQACIAVRVPVREFTPRRWQRRILARNGDIHIRPRPAEFVPEHFALYRRYLAQRHPRGGMDEPDPHHYMNFLHAGWADTEFIEMRAGHQLMAVAVVDRLADGLSAVYTFFDPDHAHRSLGTYAVLREIAETRERGLQWLYLGYWIEDCRKMRYKSGFQPLEYFRDGQWSRHPPTPAIEA